MKHTRIIVTHYGGPDALQLLEEECPAPKRGEVRVRVLAAGVSLPDLMMREGMHPETPSLPFTPGWDLVGTVDRLGDGVSGLEPGQVVAALPISGAYAEFVCLPQRELVPAPPGLDAAEAVSLVLNYITAYQMLHRSAKVRRGERVLIHGAAGGVGSALLQLGRLAGLEMYGTCSSRGASAVSDLGGIPIDYQHLDFVTEIRRLTGDGVDVVFDGIGGGHIWRSRKALRSGGRVVAYGLTASLRGGRLASGRPGRRHRVRGIAIFGVYITGGWLLPGRKRVLPYSIQWLKRLRPALFRQDLIALFNLLGEQKIKPLIARRLPLAEARHAHELLGKGGVTGKIVLVHPMPRAEQPYRIDAGWSRAVFARRTGQVAAFLMPHLQAGMRLLDCGCGPGSITVDLAQAVAPGEVIGIDLREDTLADGRALARGRGIANVRFHAASVYQLPYPEGAFDAAFACAVLQHLAAPLAALAEMRRVLKPGGVVGIVDGSSTTTFRHPTSPLLEKWDRLRALEREHTTGRRAETLPLRALLRAAGFARTQASAEMTTEAGRPAGTLDETRRVAQNHLIRLRGVLGELAIAQGWTTREELERMADALVAWGEAPDAFYARPAFTAIGWA